MAVKPTTGQTALLLLAVTGSLAIAVFVPPPQTSTLVREVRQKPRLVEAVAEALPEKPPAIAVPQTFRFRGVVLYDGPRLELAPLVIPGAKVRDAAVCAVQSIPDESLVVNPHSLGIRNVFVYLSPNEPKPAASQPAESEVLCRIEHCRFVPHAMLVRTDQQVIVQPEDPVAHNTHPFPLRNMHMQTVVPVKPEQLTFSNPEKLPFQVKCDFHPWMSAFWLVLDHPFAAITEDDGHFQIDGLPAGEYSFVVWQEKAGYLERKLQVRVGENAEPTVLKYAPEKFQK
jgi:hypothetical protein